MQALLTSRALRRVPFDAQVTNHEVDLEVIRDFGGSTTAFLPPTHPNHRSSRAMSLGVAKALALAQRLTTH
jgi:hypothetical protein